MCFLPKSCESYPSIWDYSFKIAFSQSIDQYLVVPLASFAANGVYNGNDICKIYVENLGVNETIMFGSMFFQSVSLYSRWNFTASTGVTEPYI